MKNLKSLNRLRSRSAVSGSIRPEGERAPVRMEASGLAGSHDPLARKQFKSPRGIPSRIRVTDTLDLHGFFPEQAGEMVDAFIENALSLGLSRLRIIHGKGKSRLKHEVLRVLSMDSRVAAFGDDYAFMGGWGATQVELKPQPNPSGKRS